MIGLPGDRIALRDGQVWINGEAAALQPDGTGQAENDDGSHMPAARLIETLPGDRKHTIFKLTPLQPLDNMAETVVPPGHIFVMGDNRDNSADSRVPLREGGVGMLPVDDLVGRVDGIVGSWDLGHEKPADLDLAAGLAAVAVFLGGALNLSFRGAAIRPRTRNPEPIENHQTWPMDSGPARFARVPE